MDEQARSYGGPQTQSGHRYIIEQAIGAGYIDPGLTQKYEYFHNPFLFREALKRELVKEKIREETLAAEIYRIRLLEAEERRQMIERKLELSGRGGNGFDRFSFQFGAGTIIEPRWASFERTDEQSFEKKIAMELEERSARKKRKLLCQSVCVTRGPLAP